MNQLLQRALVILISALLPYTGIGATLFSANGGGLYNSASSWSPAQVPTQNDSVVVTPGNPITNNAYANAQSLTIEAGASLTLNGSAYITRHLRVFGSLNGPAPINFIGTGMTIGGTATIFHPGNFSVFGDLTVLAGTNIAKNGFIHLQSSGITFTNLGSITLNNGTVSIASGATFLNGAGSTLSVYSNIYGGGTLDASTVANTVVYRNNANSTYPTTAYHHLTYQAGTKNISADVTINGNLTIQNSTNITGNNFTFTVGGNWTNNLSGSNITNLNVIFNGSGTQTVNKGSTEIWTNVTKAGTGTVLLNCNIQINGNFSLNSGSFDVSTANRTISLAGSWNNSGGTFVPRSGRVVFFNSAAAGLTASSGNENFFEIQKVLGGTFTINNNITVSGPFSIFAGTFACAGSQNINLAGNWSNSGGTFSPGTGTVTLTNSAARTISKTSAPETFFHLTKTGAGTSTINSAITCGGNLTLSAGTFDVGTGNNSVSIAGDGTFNATFTRRLGTVTFNGSGAQSISTSTAVTFHNLTIANTGAGVTASAGVITIDNILTPTSGNFGTAAGCRVLLPSDATRTAIIGSGSGTFSGSGFEIYRFISARPANWHDFGSPVASTTLLDWDNEIYMSGVGGADGNACCPIFNSVYRYDEPVGDYVAITSVSTTLNPGTGYSIFLGDDLTSWAGTSVVNSIGTPNSGTQSFGLSFSGASLDPGGHLVGNPHAAHLDWDAIVGASTNLDGTFYMLDNNGNYNPFGSGTQIPPHQGFFVYVTAAGTISMPQSAKTTNTASNFNRIARPYDIRLSLKSPATKFWHDIDIVFDPSATNDYDNGLDARFVKSPEKDAPNLTMVLNGSRLLTRNVFPAGSEIVTLPLRAKVGVTGNYTISAEGIPNVKDYACVILKDHFKNVTIDLRKQKSYSFDITTEDNPNRFTLFLVPEKKDCGPLLVNSQPTEYFNENQVVITNTNREVFVQFDLDNATTAEIGIYNAVGQLVNSTNSEAYKQMVKVDLPSQTGIYFIRVNTGKNIVTKKVFVQGN